MTKKSASAGAAALPTPVCHWTFDDAANPGKDSRGAADLVDNGSVATVENKAGNHGMSLKRGSSMKLPKENFPANFPLGKSAFTFSIRAMPGGGVNENTKWVTWGPVDVPANSFWFWVGAGSPRRLFFNCGYQWVPTGRTLTSAGTASAWRHYVLTHDGSNGVKVYCDGVQVGSQNQIVSIGAGDLVVGDSKQCQIDDIQIFDVALTPVEVGVLTRSLGQATFPGVIPATASVHVDAGATLTASTGYFEVASLAGAGTIDLANGALMRVADASAFTGALSGSGALASLSAMADATVSCDVVVDGAWTITDVTKPGVQTSGRVFVPTTGVLTVTNPDKNKVVDCVLAGGGQGVQASGGVDGWTSSLVEDKWRTAFSLSDDGTSFMDGGTPKIRIYRPSALVSGKVVWRDWQCSGGFEDAETLPGRLDFEVDQACASADDWDFLNGSRYVLACAAGELRGKDCFEGSFTVSRNRMNGRFPKAGPGRNLVVRARAMDAVTREFEITLHHKGGKVWGTQLRVTPEWRDIVVPLDQLRYFSHWKILPRLQEGDRPDARLLTNVRFCFGRWLCPDSLDAAHGIEIESVRITGR